jgi:hypothetical protein
MMQCVELKAAFMLKGMALRAHMQHNWKTLCLCKGKMQPRCSLLLTKLL